MRKVSRVNTICILLKRPSSIAEFVLAKTNSAILDGLFNKMQIVFTLETFLMIKFASCVGTFRI